MDRVSALARLPGVAGSMMQVSQGKAAETGISVVIALAAAGGYADPSSSLLTGSFTGNATGNTVLAAISVGSGNPHHSAALSRDSSFLAATAAGFLTSRRSTDRSSFTRVFAVSAHATPFELFWRRS